MEICNWYKYGFSGDQSSGLLIVDVLENEAAVLALSATGISDFSMLFPYLSNHAYLIFPEKF